MKAKNGIWVVAFMAVATVSGYGGGDTVAYNEPMAGSGDVSRNGPFVGVEGSYVFDMQSDVTYINEQPFIENSSGSGASFGVDIGAKENCWRVLLGYEHYANDSDDQNYERLFVQGDYFPLDDSYSMGNMFANPYLGVNVGWLNYETSGTSDENGLAYGGEVGFTKSFGEKWDVDLGARYLFSTIEEVDHIGTVSMGLHYYY
jgi:hypothetical protein